PISVPFWLKASGIRTFASSHSRLTATVSLATHPSAAVTVTVYRRADRGVQTGCWQSVQLRSVAGVHCHATIVAPPPTAAIVTGVSAMTLRSGPASTVGCGSTVTLTAAVSIKHPYRSPPTTLYTVVTAGLAVTAPPLVALNPSTAPIH